VQVYPDAASLTRAAAEHFVARAAEAVTARGRFTVALSGGSTPRSTYTLLASDEFAPRVDWPRVHAFWGDERCVPPDDPDSNYRTAHEVLLRHVPIPAGNVHRIQGELEPEPAAREYERALLTMFGSSPGGSPPRFDLVLLGMGDDGHTASLFPGTAAIHEGKRWVVAHYVDKLSVWRVTLTPAVINAAAHVTFLVSGAAKARRLREVLIGPFQPDRLPPQIVQPADGRLLWLLDAAAAAHLEGA
jgi:6-phosphogluconolactonase